MTETVESLRSAFEISGREAEVIVIDDGSTDATADRAASAGAKVVKNPINSGYGFSLKRGLAEAKHADIVIIDADGTYPVDALPKLLDEYEKGYDMVVGRRTGGEYRRGAVKYPARMVFRAIAEFAVGRSIPDINSGFRVFKKSITDRFREDLCNGFSFTTTITLLAMLQGYFVVYVPIHYRGRIGSSKVRHVRDSLRVLQIIVRAILLYNPVKIFLLLAVSAFIVGLAGLTVAAAGGDWVTGIIFAAIFIGTSVLVLALGLLADVMAMLRLHHLDNRAEERKTHEDH